MHSVYIYEYVLSWHKTFLGLGRNFVFTGEMNVKIEVDRQCDTQRRS